MGNDEMSHNGISLRPETYNVRFVVIDHDGIRWAVEFIADGQEDTKKIIAALSSYNSGDQCECYINGEKVVLDGDWGLL